MNQMRFIRTQVFGLTQTEFSVVAGVKQATVSRWESGTLPKQSEMKRIRDEAIRRGLPWHDSFFFEPSPIASTAPTEPADPFTKVNSETEAAA